MNTQEEYDTLLEKLFAWEEWLIRAFPGENQQSSQSRELKYELDKFRPKPKPARVGEISWFTANSKGEMVPTEVVELTDAVKERLGPTAGVDRPTLVSKIAIIRHMDKQTGEMADVIMQVIADAAPEVDG